MLKKLGKLLRILTIGAVWTYLFLVVANFFMREIWGFDMFSPASWKLLGDLWNKGGKIKTGKDYVFALCLLSILPVWIYGWRKSLHLNPLKVLFFPVLIYEKLTGGKGIDNNPRIVFKNVDSKKISLEELIDARMPEAGQTKNAHSDGIRQAIHHKINQAKD